MGVLGYLLLRKVMNGVFRLESGGAGLTASASIASRSTSIALTSSISAGEPVAVVTFIGSVPAIFEIILLAIDVWPAGRALVLCSLSRRTTACSEPLKNRAIVGHFARW